MPTPPPFHYLSEPILKPQPEVTWAETMILNPAIIDEPESSRLHMLFRATGPWAQAQQVGKPLPYPIFLGYAFSKDGGQSWTADFSKPCLAPPLAQTKSGLEKMNALGKPSIYYANGCIEDPRLFRIDEKCYLTTACRLFPPGPYWEHDSPMQCAPDWTLGTERKLGRAFQENVTVSVLFEIDLNDLTAGRYDTACHYVTHLTDPERGDNRDVMLFPEKLKINGKNQYICLHRPFEPHRYGKNFSNLQPSIFMAASDSLETLSGPGAEHRLLANSTLDWEGNRIGASWPPIALGKEEWLLAYHGKQDSIVGYTQSFMILDTAADGWPRVKHRCPKRLMYAQQKWELNGKFPTPCLFTCGGIVQNGKLIMSYGAADTVAGIAWTDFKQLLDYVRRFDSAGNELNS